MFVFGILQIPSGCVQVGSGCIAPTCTPLATGPILPTYSLRPILCRNISVYYTKQRHVSDDRSPNTDFRETSNIAATQNFCGFSY